MQSPFSEDETLEGVGGHETPSDHRAQLRPNIAGYRILGQLGSGGMGSVFEAEQLEPVRRRVALKVVKWGMDTREVIARFESERQALALMDHPSIARVYGAGSTERGRPYFAMELVAGIPITEYCDKHRYRTRERLELLSKVCDGVQHAHQKSIIHRDLKPSNILVTVQDNKPVPKIIDFGVAKATAQHLTERTVFTEHGQLIGTPEYMSPEQAEMTGLDVDTRTDIYSLGVILYELLTGVLPFDSRELRSLGIAEIQRRIRESEPAKPSTRIGRLEPEAAAKVAADRATDPSTLARHLAGDLDWIVMRCLDKDRTRRYATANALALELGRYLADEPVLARPPSAAYRWGKFVRRNRAAVTAGALIVAAMVTGIVGTTWGMVRARRAAEAEAAAKKEAEQVATFQSEQLAGIDVPLMGSRLHDDLVERYGRQLEARGGLSDSERTAAVEQFRDSLGEIDFVGTSLGLLDATVFEGALEAIDTKFADRPLFQARMLHTLADTMRRLGLLERATVAETRALKIRREKLGDDDPSTLEAANSLGVIQYQSGRYAQAEKLYLDTLERRRRVLGEDDPKTLQSINNLAGLFWSQGRIEEALPLVQEALARNRRVDGEDSLSTLASKRHLAILYLALRRFREAEPLYLEVLEKQRDLLGPDDPQTLSSMSSVATLYQRMGRDEEAEPLFRKVFEARRRSLGAEHPLTLRVENSLGNLLVVMGKYDEAESLLREALDGYDRAFPKDNPERLSAMNNLGGLYVDMGRLEEAEPLLQEALARRLKTLGKDHPHVGWSYYYLGCLAAARGNHDEAIRDLRRAVELDWADPRIRTEPSLDGLRGDPEFEAILRQVGERLGTGSSFSATRRSPSLDQDTPP